MRTWLGIANLENVKLHGIIKNKREIIFETFINYIDTY